MRRRIAIVTALAALVTAVPAAAAGGGLQVRKVDTSSFPTVRVTVETPTSGTAPDLQIRENGQPIPSGNVQLVDPGAPAAIALVIDTSNSMAGQKLTDAVTAAKGFVDAQKNGNVLGVYGFGATAYPAARLTTDPTEVDTAISQLGTGGAPGTALYGAVQLAANDLRTAPAQRRVMIVITDGSSDHDSATLAQALTAAKAAGVTVYPVGIATDPTAQSALEQLASATGGTASQATDSAALSSIYAQIAADLGSSYTYLYQSATAPGAPLKLELSAKGYSPVLEDLKAPGTFVPVGASGGFTVPQGSTGRILIAAIVGLFVLLAMVLIMSARPDVIVQSGSRRTPRTSARW